MKTMDSIYSSWKAFQEFESSIFLPDTQTERKKEDHASSMVSHIREWNASMLRVLAAGCHYSNLTLAFKLLASCRLSHDQLLSTLNRLKHMGVDDDSLVQQVVVCLTDLENVGLTLSIDIPEDDSSRPRAVEEAPPLEPNSISHDSDDISSAAACVDDYCIADVLNPSETNNDMLENLSMPTEGKNDRKEHNCPYCGKIFPKRRGLSEHLLACHRSPRRHACHQCPLTFPSKARLKRHLRVHTGERPFQCPECPKSFSHNSVLHAHRQRHLDKKNFLCEVCNKTFVFKKALERHLEYHNDVRPFKCEQCPKAYRRKELLNHHLRSHTGDRPFQCEFCPKSFATKVSLDRHTRVHTGEKPYQCDVCLKRFSQSNDVKKHRKIHLRKNQCHEENKPYN